MALILFFYGAFALGGEEWVVAPALALIAFCLFHLARMRPAGLETREHQVVATFYMASVPTAIFLTNNFFETMIPNPGALGGGDPFFALFVGATAAQLALFLRHLEWELVKSRWAGTLVAAVGVAVVAWIVVAPLGLRAGVDGLTRAALAPTADANASQCRQNSAPPIADADSSPAIGAPSRHHLRHHTASTPLPSPRSTQQWHPTSGAQLPSSKPNWR